MSRGLDSWHVCMSRNVRLRLVTGQVISRDPEDRTGYLTRPRRQDRLSHATQKTRQVISRDPLDKTGYLMRPRRQGQVTSRDSESWRNVQETLDTKFLQSALESDDIICSLKQNSQKCHKKQKVKYVVRLSELFPSAGLSDS